MSSIIANLAERLEGNINPNYQSEKRDMRYAAQVASIISIAALVTNVAFTILGISLCCSGAIAVGTPLILVSIPLCYFAFNINKTCENIKTINDNIKKYQNLMGFGDGFNKQKLKNELIKNTICFEWFADFMIELECGAT